MTEIERIVLDKSAYNFVVRKSLNLKNIYCKVCNKKITKNNFGWIGKDNYVCNNIVCLIQGVKEKVGGRKE